MEITFSEDVLDSRDIQERFDELESELEDLQSELDVNKEAYEDKKDDLENDGLTEEDIEEIQYELESLKEDLDGSQNNLDEWLAENEEEFELLKECIDKFGDYGEWKYGATLIHEDYWEEYVEELCKDIGDIPSDLPWYIANHIDWEGVSREIAMDYMTEEIKGNTYYMRNC